MQSFVIIFAGFCLANGKPLHLICSLKQYNHPYRLPERFFNFMMNDNNMC